MHRNKKNLRAFSTPEVLLSVFILSIGLVTIVAVMAGSLRYSMSNRDLIIASELAQEGVELVRNVRDNDFASGGTGFSAFNNGHKHCRIDWNSSSSTLDCAGNQGDASLYALQYSGGSYIHSPGGSGRFFRYISIDYDNTAPGERALVRSFVFWGIGTLPPSSGSTSGCDAAHSCVFTEAFLTAWK